MLKELMRLGSRNYFKTNRLILPIIVYISFLGVVYSVGPQKVLPTFMLQAIFLFILMTTITVTFCDSEHEVLEQIIYLKVNPKERKKIYYSKILTLTRILAILAGLATLYPTLKYYLQFHGLFDRNLTGADLVVSLLVSFLLGSLGIILGLLFNRRLFPERKMQLVLLVFVVILSIISGSIAIRVPILKVITWILPPVYEITHRIGRNEYVRGQDLLWILVGVLYYLIYLVIYIRYMKRSELTERS